MELTDVSISNRPTVLPDAGVSDTYKWIKKLQRDGYIEHLPEVTITPMESYMKQHVAYVCENTHATFEQQTDCNTRAASLFLATLCVCIDAEDKAEPNGAPCVKIWLPCRGMTQMDTLFSMLDETKLNSRSIMDVGHMLTIRLVFEGGGEVYVQESNQCFPEKHSKSLKTSLLLTYSDWKV